MTYLIALECLNLIISAPQILLDYKFNNIFVYRDPLLEFFKVSAPPSLQPLSATQQDKLWYDHHWVSYCLLPCNTAIACLTIRNQMGFRDSLNTLPALSVLAFLFIEKHYRNLRIVSECCLLLTSVTEINLSYYIPGMSERERDRLSHVFMTVHDYWRSVGDSHVYNIMACFEVRRRV